MSSDDTNSNLPTGWDNRHNQMSEKEMMLGGAAATKFASKNSYGNIDDKDSTYKNSEEVKAFYMKKIEAEMEEQQQGSSSSQPVLPLGWENRQKAKDLETQQQGVFARESSGHPQPETAPSTFLGSGKRHQPPPEFDSVSRHQPPPEFSSNNNRHQPPPEFSSGTRHRMPPTIPEQQPLENASRSVTSSSTGSNTSSAEGMLVNVTTHTLENMAQALEQNPVALSQEERAAFASAMQRAMTAIGKCR